MMYLAVKELQQQSINGSPPTTVAKQLMFDGKNVKVKMDQCINGKCQTKKMTMKKGPHFSSKKSKTKYKKVVFNFSQLPLGPRRKLRNV